MPSLTKIVGDAVDSVKNTDNRKIDIAIILGSGLGDIYPDLNNVTEIKYSDIKHLNATSVQSHKGRLLIGELNGQCIAVCQGRHHLYEGYSAQEVATLVYTLSRLGAKQLIITNAAGALNPAYQTGDIMLIEDHINFTGQNPVVSQDDTLGQRFTDMSQAYNHALLEQAKQICLEKQFNYHQGIYACLLYTSPSPRDS